MARGGEGLASPRALHLRGEDKVSDLRFCVCFWSISGPGSSISGRVDRSMYTSRKDGVRACLFDEIELLWAGSAGPEGEMLDQVRHASLLLCLQHGAHLRVRFGIGGMHARSASALLQRSHLSVTGNDRDHAIPRAVETRGIRLQQQHLV